MRRVAARKSSAFLTQNHIPFRPKCDPWNKSRIAELPALNRGRRNRKATAAYRNKNRVRWTAIIGFSATRRSG